MRYAALDGSLQQRTRKNTENTFPERTNQDPRRRRRGAGFVLRQAAGVKGATVAKYGDAKVYPTLTASLAFFVSLIGQVELPFTQ